MILLFDILGELLLKTPWHSTKSLIGKGDSAHKNMADVPPALTLAPWNEVCIPIDIPFVFEQWPHYEGR